MKTSSFLYLFWNILLLKLWEEKMIVSFAGKKDVFIDHSNIVFYGLLFYNVTKIWKQSKRLLINLLCTNVVIECIILYKYVLFYGI